MPSNLRLDLCWVALTLLAGCGKSPSLNEESGASPGGNANGGGAGNAANNDGAAGNAAGISATGSNAGTTNGGAGGSEAAGAGNGGESGGAGGNSTAGNAGQAGSFSDAGADAGSGISIEQVKPSAGCGTLPNQATGTLVMHTIQTSGTKAVDCADSACGAWSYLREYYVWLPPGYDENHAYSLIIEAQGCSSKGSQVYPLLPGDSEISATPNTTAIRVGLTPPPNEIGHATNPNQGCFDDKEGDDSVDFVFYETLIDQLKSELCYDENRVFAAGTSSGAWLTNELGCKYAGPGPYSIRGVAAHQGGLPTDPQFAPTCSDQPMAGMWASRPSETTLDVTRYAISHALQVNGCEAMSYDTAQLIPFPFDSEPNMCQRVVGCPEEYPVVVCTLPQGILSDDRYVIPAFSAFIQGFAAP